MPTGKDKKNSKKRSLSWAVPARDNDLYIRALDACAELHSQPAPGQDRTHGPRSSLINTLIYQHFLELGLIDDQKVFSREAIEKIEQQVDEARRKPKIEKKGA